MKVLYRESDGRIFYCVYDADWFKFAHSTNIELATLEIDEVDPDNKAICRDLATTQSKRDINGNPKYYISEGDIYERENWEEYVEEIP
jgi:hypothetical protein